MLGVKTRCRRFAIQAIALAGLLWQSAQGGGAWGRKTGSYYLNLGFYYLNQNEYYNNEGEVTEGGTFFRQATSVYGEYGIRPWLTAVWDWAFYFHRFEDEQTGHSRNNSGMGDLNASLHAVVWKKWVRLGLGAGAGLPFGESKSDALATGDGETDYRFSLFAAKALKPLSLGGTLAYRLRTEGFTPGWEYGVRLGYRFRSEASLSLISNGVRLFEEPEPARIQSPYLGFGEGVEYDLQGIALNYPFMGTHLSFAYYTHVWGMARNVIAQAYFVVGMGFDF